MLVGRGAKVKNLMKVKEEESAKAGVTHLVGRAWYAEECFSYSSDSGPLAEQTGGAGVQSRTRANSCASC